MESFQKQCDKAYVEGEPIVSDGEYDALFPEAVGFTPDAASGDRVMLPCWMGSLDKVREPKTLSRWLSKNESGKYIVSAKLDGMSALLYGDRLYSRGNGRRGTDLTRHLDILGLPRGLNVRGELVMKTVVFENKYQTEFKNSRNLVAGTLGRKDPSPNVMSDISFIAYEIIDTQLTPQQQMDKLKSHGFEVPMFQVIKTPTIEELGDILEEFHKTAGVSIDGLVLQPNTPYKRNSSGNPSYSIAFKKEVDSNMAVGDVTEVVWNISKWGVYKPVVLIKPTELCGVTITKLTAFNAKYVVENKLGAGAKVIFKRSGDVIPHIIRVVSPGHVELPCTNWDGVNLKHIGPTREADVKRIVEIFRKMEIKFVSHATVSKLFDAGFDTLEKILRATEDSLLKAGLGPRSTNRVFTNIRSGFMGGPVSLARVVGASGVLGCGMGEKKIATLLEIPNFTTACPDIKTIGAMKGFSAITAKKVVDHYDDMVELLDSLERSGVVFEAEHSPHTQKYCLSGFRSTKIPNQVPSVVKGCILITSGDRETTKVAMAKKLNVPIITKNDYFSLLQ